MLLTSCLPSGATCWLSAPVCLRHSIPAPVCLRLSNPTLHVGSDLNRGRGNSAYVFVVEAGLAVGGGFAFLHVGVAVPGVVVVVNMAPRRS